MVVFVIYMEALHVYECLPKKDNETVEWSKQTCMIERWGRGTINGNRKAWYKVTVSTGGIVWVILVSLGKFLENCPLIFQKHILQTSQRIDDI